MRSPTGMQKITKERYKMSFDRFTNERRARSWRFLLITGLISVAAGILFMFTPTTLFVGISLLFSLIFLISGAAGIGYSLATKSYSDNWVWSLMTGVISLLMGALLFFKPQISVVAIPVLIGAIVLIKSLGLVRWSFLARQFDDKASGWLLAIGLLGAIVAILVFRNPIFIGTALAIMIALSLIAGGVFQIWLACRLKSTR